MVERIKQLGNVAFGGSWSEELIQSVTIDEVLEVLRRAAKSCDEVDPRGEELTEALNYVEMQLHKGRTYRAGIERGLSLQDPSQRKSELLRYVSLIEAWM